MAKGMFIFYVFRFLIKPSFREKVYNYFYVFMRYVLACLICMSYCI